MARGQGAPKRNKRGRAAAPGPAAQKERPAKRGRAGRQQRLSDDVFEAEDSDPEEVKNTRRYDVSWGGLNRAAACLRSAGPVSKYPQFITKALNKSLSFISGVNSPAGPGWQASAHNNNPA